MVVVPVKVSVRSEEFSVSRDGKGIKAEIIDRMFWGNTTTWLG